MRRTIDLGLRCLTGGCLLACLTIAGGLIWAIVSRGWGALSLSFFTEHIKNEQVGTFVPQTLNCHCHIDTSTYF